MDYDWLDGLLEFEEEQEGIDEEESLQYKRLCDALAMPDVPFNPMDHPSSPYGLSLAPCSIALDKTEDELCAMAAAAGAALDASTTASTSILAMTALQVLPPRLSVVHHEAVARHLRSRMLEFSMLSAHTLACMGPEAVAEHFEEVVAIAQEAGDCDLFAWLAVCVLEPSHLLRLEVWNRP